MPRPGGLFARRGAHKVGRRGHPDPSEVEAVRIPAGTDRGILGMVLVRVPSAGEDETLKGIVLKVEERAAHFQGVVSPAFSVFRVGPVVDPARIVEPGEEPHDKKIATRMFSEPEPVAFHPPPMRGTVNRAASKSEGSRHGAGQFVEVAVAVGICGSV